MSDHSNHSGHRCLERTKHFIGRLFFNLPQFCSEAETSFQPRLFQTRCTNLKFWFCFLLRIWSVFQSAFEIQAQLLEKAKYDGCSAFVEMVPLSQIHLSVVVRALGSFSVVYSCWFNRLLASASLRASKTLKERSIIRAGYEPCGLEWKD